MENKPKKDLYWRAVYEDKSFLMQYETKKGKQVENKYPAIDREKLVRFDLLDFETNKAVYSLWLNEGQKLIYRRRTLKEVNFRTHQIKNYVVWIVGYQHTIMTGSGPRNFVVCNYIYEDGSIALDGARDNLELYPIEL